MTASILAGAAAVLTVQLTLGDTPGSIWTPATLGLLSASAVYGVGVGWRSVGRRR